MKSADSAHDGRGAALPSLARIGPRHVAYVRVLLSRFRIRPAHESEDLLQEILLQAHRSQGSRLEPAALLSGIASHVVFRWCEKVRRGAAAHKRYAADNTDGEVQRSPEEDLQEAERVCAVRSILRALPADLGGLFEAVALDGRSVAEVAAEAEMSVNTAYTRLHVARDRVIAALHRRLARCGIGEGDL